MKKRDYNNENDDSDGEKIEIVSNLNKKVQNVVGEIGKKSRGKNEAYVFIAKFNDKKEALVELDTQNCWIKGTRKENKSDGTKQNYLCKHHVIAKCKCKCFLLYHNTSDNVSLYKSVTEHNDHQKLTDHGKVRAHQNWSDLKYFDFF
jgi:hypothetical protein